MTSQGKTSGTPEQRERLTGLTRAALLDNQREEVLDGLARLTARCAQAPAALIALMDGGSARIVSAFGVQQPWATRREAVAASALCAQIAATREPLIFADARDQPALRTAVEQGVIAFAGAPVAGVDGRLLGVLCALDHEARAWSAEQLTNLRDLARATLAELELRVNGARLREREAIVSALNDSLNDAIVSADESGRIVWWNSAAERMFGFTAEQVRGQSLTLLMPERYRAAHAAGIARLREGGESRLLGSTIEIEAVRSSGAEFPVELSLSRWSSPLGAFYTGVLRDVTARKLHADALRRAEEQLRLTIDHAPIGMALIALDGRFLRVNRALCQLVGYDAETLVTLTFQAITHPDDLAADMELVQLLLAGSIPRYQLAKRYLHRDGFPVDIMLHVSLVRDGDGTPRHFISQIEDVTSKKRAEAELQHKTMMLESVLANMNDGVVVANGAGELLLVNPAAERMLGKSEGGRIDSWSGTYTVHGADGVTPLAEDQLPMRRALRGEQVDQSDLFVRTHRHPEGRWHSVSASPLRHDDGTLWGAMSVGRDVTRLKRAELALREQTSITQLLEAVAAAANEAPTSKRALQTCLRLICEFMGWPVGHVYLTDGPRLLPSELWHLSDRVKFATFREVTGRTHLAAGLDLPGRVLATGKPAWMQDVQADPAFLRARAAESLGVHAGFAFPLLVGEEIFAVLEFYAERPAVPDARTLDVMQHVGTQLGRVVERERHAEAVRNLSLTDELTGLNNRRGFLALADAQLRLAARAAKPCVLVFIDMDGLKQINDELGHELGDAALVELSRVMRRTFRESDILGRLGGDEFVALLPEMTTENASVVLNRLQEKLTVHNVTERRSYVLAASAGITAFDPKQPTPIEDLLAEADTSMYEQKRRRKVGARPSIIMR